MVLDGNMFILRMDLGFSKSAIALILLASVSAVALVNAIYSDSVTDLYLRES